jgi:uncharacterized membrane protein (UPF0127 family)
MHHRHWLIVGAAVGIAALAGIYIVHTYAAATPNYVPTITPYSVNQMLPTKTIAVGTTTLTVEVATTPAEQAGGLSGRTGLAPGTGMLFVFPTAGAYQFWMKDMQFAIDMLWLDSEGTVTYIAANATPESYTQTPPQTFGTQTPSQYVLEVPAGWAAAHGVAEGCKFVL